MILLAFPLMMKPFKEEKHSYPLTCFPRTVSAVMPPIGSVAALLRKKATTLRRRTLSYDVSGKIEKILARKA